MKDSSKSKTDSFLSHSGSSPPEKKCTKCLVSKPLSMFYSKGSRCSSKCKKCEKELKKAKYLVQKNKIDVETLKRVFDIIYCYQIQEIQLEIYRIEEVLKDACKK